MFSANRISKTYGPVTVLSEITFQLNAGERLALVGPNGCGKTTLLRIISRIEKPDAGTLAFNPPGLRLGYLPQGLQLREGDSLRRFLTGSQDVETLTREIEALAAGLANSPDDRDLQQRYDRSLSQLALQAESEGQIPAVLAALGLDGFPLDEVVAHLSGGQKTRLALARALLTNPQLLLLDEPTNHLDLDMLGWLEERLLAFRGAILFVSHDRMFLNRVATSVLEIDPFTHEGKRFTGGYTSYLEAKIAERERQWQEYTDQQEEIARLRSGAARIRSDARYRPGGKGSGDKFAKGFFANRTKETVRKAKNIEKRVERMLNEDRVEKPQQSWQMRVGFDGVPESGREVLKLEEVSVGYNGSPLLEGITYTLRNGRRAALIGPNGCGKTTLLRTISGGLPPISGSIRLGSGVQLGYMRQEQEDLDFGLDAFSVIRKVAPMSETSTRTFLHQFLFSGEEVYRKVGDLSYGERARLSLAVLVARGCNLLLLDEPINHLDIPSRSRFEQALANFEGTVLAVVHDRYFLEGFAEEIWEVRDGKVRIYLP